MFGDRNGKQSNRMVAILNATDIQYAVSDVRIQYFVLNINVSHHVSPAVPLVVVEVLWVVEPPPPHRSPGRGLHQAGMTQCGVKLYIIGLSINSILETNLFQI